MAMAALGGLALRTGAQRLVGRSAILSRGYADKMMADPLEHATGLEKRELLAMAAGNMDPFNTHAITRNEGTKDKPNLIPSAFDSRIVGCVCNEDAASIRWMWLHRDEPRRCNCGHWFKLIYKAPI